jgi:hypothetical protein
VLAAQLDALKRQMRESERVRERSGRADELEALDSKLDQLHDLAELVARTALAAAGYHQHHRGEWRKRRVQRDETC